EKIGKHFGYFERVFRFQIKINFLLINYLTYPQKESKAKLVEEEKMESGQITLAVYKKFFRALTPLLSISMVLNYLLMVASSYGANFYLSAWMEMVDPDPKWNLLVYFLIGSASCIFIIVGWMSIVRGTLRA